MIKKTLKFSLVLLATFSMTSAYAGWGVFTCIDLNGGPQAPAEYGCWTGSGCSQQLACGDASSTGDPKK